MLPHLRLMSNVLETHDDEMMRESPQEDTARGRASLKVMQGCSRAGIVHSLCVCVRVCAVQCLVIGVVTWRSAGPSLTPCISCGTCLIPEIILFYVTVS